MIPIVQPKTTFCADDVHVGEPARSCARSTPEPDSIALPVGRLDLRTERVEAFGVLVDEAVVTAAAFEHQLGDAGQQRDVAADVRLHVQAGDGGAEQQAAQVDWARGS